MPKEYKILLAIALGAIIIGVLLFKFAGNPVQRAPLAERSGAYTLGNPAAKVRVTEFADFQCPACRQATDYTPQLLAKYPNDVMIVFRHFPLPTHPLAQLSAQAAEAAGVQGKFWEMHDLLYEKQNEWGDLSKATSRGDALNFFRGYARELGLDENKLAAAIESNAGSAAINEDISAGNASGVNSTPQFFVNGTMIDNPSLADITAEIDKALGR